METVIFIGFQLLSIAEAGVQFFLSSRFLEKKPKAWHTFFYILFFELFSLLTQPLQSAMLSEGINLLWLYAANRIFLKSGRTASLLAVVLITSVMRLSFGILNGLFYMLLPYVRLGTATAYFIAFLFPALSLALCFCCCRLAAKRFYLRQGVSAPFSVFIPMFLLYAMGFYITNTVYGNVIEIPLTVEPGKHLELMALQALGLCAMFSTLNAYQKLCDGYIASSKLALLEQQAHMQKIYVDEAKQRYQATRAFRHDIKNHLSVLDGLLKAGETERAGAYLQKLEAITSELSFPFKTGIIAVDILLGSKLELARKNAIEVSCSVLFPKNCIVDDFDLCVIFSNALDNAVNACVKTEGRRFLHISGQRQGDFYLLEFENSCGLKMTQEIEMGIGLINIKTAVEKYGGVMTIDRRPGYFCLNALLNIS